MLYIFLLLNLLTLLQAEADNDVNILHLTSAQKRRTRRKRLQAARATAAPIQTVLNTVNLLNNTILLKDTANKLKDQVCTKTYSKGKIETVIHKNYIQAINMSSKESRDDVLAARDAKKLAKQKAKHKRDSQKEVDEKIKKEVPLLKNPKVVTPNKTECKEVKQETPKSKDVVDRVEVEGVGDNLKSRDQIKAERAAKKTSKLSKKKVDNVTINQDMTVKDIAETLKGIKNIFKDMQDLTSKVSALNFEANKVPLIIWAFCLVNVLQWFARLSKGLL